MNKLTIFIATLVILAIGALSIAKKPSPSATNFQECADAGYPIMESYPPQCRTAEGKTFTQDIGNELEKADLIRVTTPRPNTHVQSPLTIEGEARGTWFFEATFPIRLEDKNGKVLVETFATADGEWMIEDFVPFTAELEYSPAIGQATLILEKNNPSGLPENEDELRIPVMLQ